MLRMPLELSSSDKPFFRNLSSFWAERTPDRAGCRLDSDPCSEPGCVGQQIVAKTASRVITRLESRQAAVSDESNEKWDVGSQRSCRHSPFGAKAPLRSHVFPDAALARWGTDSVTFPKRGFDSDRISCEIPSYHVPFLRLSLSIHSKMRSKILRVGIIGCGEIAQVGHIPIYNFLNTKFRTTYLCDASHDALSHCAKMVQGGVPKTTTDPEELCSSPDVDVVLICNGDEAHVICGILALKYDKWCLIEKPLALCYRDVYALIDAEKESKGRVFVGTMRRYAPAFLEAVDEVKKMGPILYARVRAIIGPNSNFVSQSTTYPRLFSDFTDGDKKLRAQREKDIVETALRDEFGVAVTEESIKMLRMLGR